MESRACTPGIMYITVLPLMFYSGLTILLLAGTPWNWRLLLAWVSHAPVLINNDF